MHEIHAIAAAIGQLRRMNEPALLATLVAVEGSSYRRPGARLLVTRAGKRIGAISGGCLEKHVARHGWSATEGRRAALLTYDTRAADDAFWTAASGCDGRLQVLVERIIPGGALHCIEHVAALLGGGRNCTVATIYDRHGDGFTKNLDLGAACVIDDAGAILGAADLFAASGLLPLICQSNEDGPRRDLRVQAPDGGLRVLVERMTPAPELVAFGAGRDAAALVRAIKLLHWRVTVAAPRSPDLSGDFQGADEVVQLDRGGADVRGLGINSGAFCVLMTHSYAADLAALRAALTANCQYIGVLGPARRTRQMVDDLSAEGRVVTDAQRGNLHGPVGLDIGAETSEEIAAAIVAEMLAVKSGRCGTVLRARTRPIHPPTPTCVHALGVGIA